MRKRNIAGIVLVIAIVVIAPVTAQDAHPLRWSLRDVDTGLHLIRHERVIGERHDTERAGQESSDPNVEAIHFRAGYGTQALAMTAIPPARVINELQVSVPVKSNQSGLQAMVRVVLPRSVDPRTGAPLTVVVRGTALESTTDWETLTVCDIPKALDREVRLLQLSHEETIDVREAYIDMAIVNVYGGAGNSAVALGQPHVEGAAAIPTHGLDGAAFRSVSFQHRRAMPGPRVDGGLLRVGERPFFVKMTDHNGEAWAELRALGVNTLRLSKPPTMEQISQARELGLWLVTPPPRYVADANHLDRVLAWDLGDPATSGDPVDLYAFEKRCRLLRASRLPKLPLVCQASLQGAELSQSANVLIHEPCGPSLMHDRQSFNRWLSRRMHNSRPTTVHWASIPTQPSAAEVEQAKALEATAEPRYEVETIRQCALAAAAMGTRGIYFRSRNALDRDSRAARLRRLAVRRACLEIDLLLPWLAAGESSAPLAISNCGSRLLPIRNHQATLFVLDGPLENPAGFRCVIPDVITTTRAYRLNPGGVVPLALRRVAGGVALQSTDLASGAAMTGILTTSDEALVRATAERVNRFSKPLAESMIEQLEVEATTSSDEPGALETQIESVKAAMQKSNLIAAHERGSSLLHRIHMKRMHHWARRRRALPSLASCPLAAYPSTRLQLERFLARVPRTGQSVNLLSGGGFDDDRALHDAMWHVTTPDHGRAVITSDDPSSGMGCLRLTTLPPANSANERSGVTITSPRISLGSGQFLISGWVRFSNPKRTPAEVVITDTLGGTSQALRIEPAGPQWRPFAIFRGVSSADHLQLAISLSGVGTADVDEVSIAPIGLR